MKRLLRLKHFLFPHAGNYYKPHIFAKESVIAIILTILLVEGVYFFHTGVVLKKTGFLSAVLPAALAELANGDRAASGAPALARDAVLAKAAQKKADDMADRGYFSHISPEGKTPWYWLDAVGYKYSYAGENLAINFTDSMDVESAWMDSPEHRANVVKPQYTKIGIGIAQGMYEGQPTTFVVEFLATPAHVVAPSPPPGTAINNSADSSAPSTTNVSDANKVLSAQDEKSAGALAALASSPNHVLASILVGFVAIVALLLFLAIFVKTKVQHVGIIVGGALMLAIALILLYFNARSASSVKLPSDAQAASVSLTL